MALPGVQVLFAFLLAVPFQQNFTKISPFEEKVYFAVLLSTAISAALLIAPSASHRLTFHYQQKHRLVFLANRFAIAGLSFLAVAMTGAVLLITNFLFGTAATVVTSRRASSPRLSPKLGVRCQPAMQPSERRRRGIWRSSVALGAVNQDFELAALAQG